MADEPADPAKSRFIMLQLMRLGGLLLILGAILILTDKVAGPHLLGYGLLVFGLFEFFFLPLILNRRWRTPKGPPKE
ncbi:MAG: hypothetical protein JY451_08650 [Erythrobacter sp.]|nr:MAG: hypothetical protein JY451_08650 [Erythrobacter sp.]